MDTTPTPTDTQARLEHCEALAAQLQQLCADQARAIQRLEIQLEALRKP
jgi:hypothetical protein